MKKDRLKPWVYKVKGEKYYALYDLFYGKIFQISPEGDLKDFRESLLKENLIFESDGIVPCKINIDLKKEMSEVKIREFQIRLDGFREDTCWSRNRVSQADETMDINTIKILLEQTKPLSIKHIRLESSLYNEKIHELVNLIILSISPVDIEFYCSRQLVKRNQDLLDELSRDRPENIVIKYKQPVDLSDFDINAYRFFYSRLFNPCLGQKVAVDFNGEIMPCLWLNEILGNILEDNIKDMIIAGHFTPFWELQKDQVIGCNNCEMRYGCNDCRVSPVSGKFSMDHRPGFCKKEKNDL